MRVTLQEFVPYHRSFLWTIQDAYFAAKGSEAWTEGGIPFFASSHYAMARQHALMVNDTVEELEERGLRRDTDEIALLEVGAGLGEFAANFIEALGRGCGARGRRLLGRLRYVLSDYSSRSLREAAAGPALASFVADRTVVPALLDLREPASLRTLEGERLHFDFTAILANYVMGNTPARIFRVESGQTLERYCALHVESEDGASAEEVRSRLLARVAEETILEHLSVESEWRAVDLDTAFTRPTHARAVRTILDIHPRHPATLTYPEMFLEALVSFSLESGSQATFLVSDLGSCRASSLLREHEASEVRYDNTVVHGLYLPLLNAFSEANGWSCLRTDDPTLSVHTVAIRTAPNPGDSFHSAFHRCYVRNPRGQEFLDARRAGLEAVRTGDNPRAVRHFRRCLELDPRNVEILFRLGRACLDADLPEDALPYLHSGRRRDERGRLDFAFQLGRAYHRLLDPRRAARWYARSLKREDSATTRTNLGLLAFEEKDYARARGHLERAAELDSSDTRSRDLLDVIREKEGIDA